MVTYDQIQFVTQQCVLPILEQKATDYTTTKYLKNGTKESTKQLNIASDCILHSLAFMHAALHRDAALNFALFNGSDGNP